MTIPDTETIERLRGLDSYLGSQILGQEEIISDITRLVQRAFCGIRLPSRPIASMLFLGPTGVGKTETAELLTRRLFGTREKLIRLDMSEYMTVDSIEILRGANITEDGVLGLYHARTGGSGMILFNEIEKAHRLILDLLLQILSAARFTIVLATRFPHDVDINLVYRKHCLHCFSRFIKRALNSAPKSKKRIYATANKIKGVFDKSYWRERLQKTAGNFRNLAAGHTLSVSY